MRILIISSILLALSSCTLPFGNKTTETPVTPPVTTTQTSATIDGPVIASGSKATINYTLHEGTADGKVLETTSESVAIQYGIFTTGSTYQPFQVDIGTNSVIVGFERGLLGMKKGELKMIQVLPEDGYGTGAVLKEIPKYVIAPVFTMTQDKKLLEDTVTQTVEKSSLNDEMKNAKVGQILTGANGATAKVMESTDTSVTFEIENVDNPFYKKEVKVGAVADNAGATFKIVSITDTSVVLEVTNKESPFYNKKFDIGEKFFPIPGGPEVSIVAIGEDTVTIGETHPLAGKTLYFDVEIVDVEASKVQ